MSEKIHSDHESERVTTGHIHIRMPPSIARQMKIIALSNDVTLTIWIARLVKAEFEKLGIIKRGTPLKLFLSQTQDKDENESKGG